MTSQEFHIDLDLKLQKLNSNATKNIEPEEKDWLINNEVIKFLDSRTRDLSDEKRLGFQADFKRLKDVKELINHVDLDVEFLNKNEGRAVLPSFVYKEIAINSRMFKDCKTANYELKERVIKYSNFKLPKGKKFSVVIKDKGKTITIFSSSSVPNRYLETDNYFYLLQAFYEKMRNSEYKERFYYNNYGNIYNKSSFFITGGSTFEKVEINISSDTDSDKNVISYSSINNNKNYYSLKLAGTKKNFSTKTTIDRDMRVINEEYFNRLSQSYFSESLPESPISAISQGFINVLYPKNIIIQSLKFTYLKKPSLINISLDSSLELSDSICKEIVDNTVDTIKDLVKDGAYKEYMSKNKIIE